MQQGEAWDNRFWKAQIPRYNAVLDKHCVAYRRTCLRPRTSSTDHSRPPLFPSKSSLVQESVLAQVLSEIEQAWKIHRIPEEYKRLYRSLFSRMNDHEVARFITSEVPRLREGTSLIQQTLASISTREDLLLRVKKLTTRLGLLQVEALQWKLAEHIALLRAASLDVAELVFAILDQLKPVLNFHADDVFFPWKEQDYLGKMMTDIHFLQKAKISRILNAGSNADPMLLSAGLKPPDNKELVTYRTKEKFTPQVIDGKVVVPVLRKDVERLVFVNTRLCRNNGLMFARPPPEQSSASNSRYGGSADPAKPILPLRLKVLIQRFQSTQTEEENSTVNHTRAASQMEERGVEVEGVEEEWVEEVLREVVEMEVGEWRVAESVLCTLVEVMTQETVTEETAIPPTLPPFSETAPLHPSFSPLSCYEEQFLPLLHTYYSQLPVSLLNVSEKAVQLSAECILATQPQFYWVTDQDRLCGLVIYYTSCTDIILAHMSTLQEDWYGLILPSLLLKFTDFAGKLIVPLHVWNGNESDIEKFATALVENGFDILHDSKWTHYKRVYVRQFGIQAKISHVTVEIDGETNWYISPSEVPLNLASFEIRDMQGRTYIRFKSAKVWKEQEAPSRVRISDAAGNFELLFLMQETGVDLSSSEVIGQKWSEYPGEEADSEVWIPLFPPLHIDFHPTHQRDALLGVLRRPLRLDFPFIFALRETGSQRVICARYVTCASSES